MIDESFPGGLFNGKTLTFWRQLVQTNFASYWARVNTRVLSVHGASDYVTYRADHELIAEIVNRAHPGWGQYREAPASDHLFWNWPTEAESQKNFPNGRFGDSFLTIARNWIDEALSDK